MKIVVYNLGCKVNQYECDCMVKKLRENGHDVSEKLQVADIYILNTCAVTNEAERKSRQFARKCQKLNGYASVYVCGCASQNNPQQFERLGASGIIGVANKMQLLNFDKFDNSCTAVETLPTIYEDNFTPTVDRTRAYVKIQDGCNNFCSYCLIPYLRGRNRSRPLQSVVDECARLSAMTKEIVLTGIDMSSYGKDSNLSLAKLLRALSGINCRIRLGSLEVGVIDDEFLIATKTLANFCPEFHLSLQSGSDSVLKKMNRHYTSGEYYEKVQLICEFYPKATITTDLICGFPTETEEEFCESIEFLKKVKFVQVHIFGYSQRAGTVAAKLPQLDKKVVKERVDIAEKVAFIARQRVLESYVGDTLQVLVESKSGENFCGYSKEYISVEIEKAEENHVENVKILRVENDKLYGIIV